MVAGGRIGLPTRSYNECNPYRAFVMWMALTKSMASLAAPLGFTPRLDQSLMTDASVI